MPWPKKVLVSLIFFVLLVVSSSSAMSQTTITVQAGAPVNLVASSNLGAPNYNGTPCGPDNSYICPGGTVQPNGNIQWTVDGAPASSSYDAVRASGAYCSADGNVNYYTYCYSYWDESGYTAVLSVGTHTVTASISSTQDPYAAFTNTWTVLVTGSVVSNPQTKIYNFSAKDDSGNSGYASNGNLLKYSDTVTGSWTMSYDAVNRLHTGIAANGPYSGASITWDYDSFGNRLHQDATGNANVPTAWATYYANNKLSTNQLAPNSNTLGYDPAGNMTFDGTNNVIYDGEGRVCAVASYNYATQSMLVTQYLYDAEGNRIAKGHPIGNSSTPSCPTGPGDFQPDEKYIVGENGEQLTQLDGSDNWQHTNVWVGRQLLATYDNQPTTIDGQTVAQPLHFNVTDPLGTKRLQVSAAGIPELTCLSLPFGDGPDCSGTEATTHRFTGKERDPESKLDYFGARHYSSSMGRFMSPDWSSKAEAVPYASLDNPQSLNLYGYVNNNPLSGADPDGHWPGVFSIIGWSNIVDGAVAEYQHQLQNDQSSSQAQQAQQQVGTNEAPSGGPPVKPPRGNNGEENSWVPKNPSDNGNREGAYESKFPTGRTPAGKGSRAGASWDQGDPEKGIPGHWDVDDGFGGPRRRYTPDGTQIDHWGNPTKSPSGLPKISPQAAKAAATVGFWGAVGAIAIKIIEGAAIVAAVP